MPSAGTRTSTAPDSGRSRVFQETSAQRQLPGKPGAPHTTRTARRPRRARACLPPGRRYQRCNPLKRPAITAPLRGCWRQSNAPTQAGAGPAQLSGRCAEVSAKRCPGKFLIFRPPARRHLWRGHTENRDFPCRNSREFRLRPVQAVAQRPADQRRKPAISCG